MYGTANGVSALLPGVGLDYNSTPDAPGVETWLGEGAAEIDVALSSAGYVVPVTQGAIVYKRLAALNNLYAAAYALRARGLDVLIGESEMRSDVWLREFREGLAALSASDLTGAGVSQREIVGQPRRHVRTIQMRRVDGYSNGYGVTE